MSHQVLCACGCQQPTTLAKQTVKRLGHVKGLPLRFLPSHNFANRPKKQRKIIQGYVAVLALDHPDAMVDGYKLEHLLVAERALGYPIPAGVIVHHHDRNRQNNQNSNLVICEDVAYHHLLHLRMRALDACGNANWRTCRYCKQWDAVENLTLHENKYNTWYDHRACAREDSRLPSRRQHVREWRARNRHPKGIAHAR